MIPGLKLALWIAGGIVLGLAIMWAGWTMDSRRRLKAEALTATQSATLETATGKITERTFHTEKIILEKADPIVQTIEAAPGADDALPPDVRVAHHDGIASLRDDTGAGEDQGSRSAGGELPPS